MQQKSETHHSYLHRSLVLLFGLLPCTTAMAGKPAPERLINLSPMWWFFIILAVDFLIFAVVYLRNRRQRKKKEEQRIAILAEDATGKVQVKLPKKNAVYTFGGLQVFDGNGQEVSQQFSPLLQELFLLLLVRSAGEGISSEELTTILWFDKTYASAKNNRAVNISKLRSLLAGIDDCTITKQVGMWRIAFPKTVFVDYYECLPGQLKLDSMTPDRVKILAALVGKGSSMRGFDQLWLDKYKAELSHNIIDTLLKYATLLDENEEHTTKILICNIVFSFDSVNEEALRLLCTTYVRMRKQYMARQAYDHFCREYKDLYGEDFTLSFNHIISNS